MANLYEILADAEDGEAVSMLAREFGITPQQTDAALTALLPAISTGLKRSTATPEGLGNLLGVMGRQRDLHAMYGDPKIALAQEGRSAGNDVLSVIFGSPDVSRAVADQAQHFSGVSSVILKKMLPVLAGILISGLMGKKGAAQQGPAAPSGTGGGLGDILGQIFGRATQAPVGLPQQIPNPGGQSIPIPTNPGDPAIPNNDLLGYILRELEKGVREGRIKPVIVDGGRVQVPLPDGQAVPTPGGPQPPGGDILGQILRDMLGGAGSPGRQPRSPQQSPQMKDLSDLSKQLGVMDGVGAAVFGDRFEVGRDVGRDQLDGMQRLFDTFAGQQRRR